MQDKKITAGILNDLITINKNRITGYKEAVHLNNDDDTKSTALLKEMIRQSEHYLEELKERVKGEGEEVEDRTNTSGIIYNIWMDILYANADDSKPDKKIFSQQLEETTLQAYESVSQQLSGTEKDIRDLINSQKEGIKHSLEVIKGL